MNENDILDPWRQMYPDEFKYTWKRNTPRIWERLDYILISEPLMSLIDSTDILPAFHSEHCPIATIK